MKDFNMMLSMMVAVQKEEETINKAIEALNKVKESDYNDEDLIDDAAGKCFMVYLKRTQHGKTFDEVVLEVKEKANIAKKATDLHNLMKKNNIS